jgi:UPF0716 protein FxsA
LIFVGVPILEIVLFIEIGGAIGLLPTLAIIFLTAIAGVVIVRWQGMRALDRLRVSLETGQDAAGPIAHGALILVAGVLLVMPGFFTDFLGLLLLIPPVRSLLIGLGAPRVTVRAATYVRRPAGRPSPVETIEAEYEVIDDVPPQRRGGSGWTRPQS